jgi:hypothetical protein
MRENRFKGKITTGSYRVFTPIVSQHLRLANALLVGPGQALCDIVRIDVITKIIALPFGPAITMRVGGTTASRYIARFFERAFRWTCRLVSSCASRVVSDCCTRCRGDATPKISVRPSGYLLMSFSPSRPTTGTPAFSAEFEASNQASAASRSSSSTVRSVTLLPIFRIYQLGAVAATARL